MSQREKISFILVLIIATFCMGSSFPTGKFLISTENIPPFYLGGFRFFIAGCLVLWVCVHREGWRKVLPMNQGSLKRGFLHVTWIGVLQTTAAMGFLNLALMRIDSALASVLFFTNPLWVLIFAHCLKIERLYLQRLIGLVIGIVGVSLCLKIGAGHNYWGMLFALLGAMSWALCTVSVRSFCRIDNSALVLAGWQMCLGGFILWIISLIFSERYDFLELSGWGIFNLAWLILPASIGSFTLWFVALQKGGAAQASSFLFLTPMFATVFASLLLGEELTMKFIAGCALIFLSIYLVNKKIMWRVRPN